MSDDSAPVLVTGATGSRAARPPARSGGRRSRPRPGARSGTPAPRCRALGAELVTGDLHDRDSLVRAAAGARAVFSVQMPAIPRTVSTSTARWPRASTWSRPRRIAGVPQFVHTSVTGAGQHAEHPRWATGRWAVESSLTAKTAVQDRVRAAGFPHWTLLKPGTFMVNFLPSMAFMFPRGVEGGLVSVLAPQTRLSLIAVDDIGSAAAAASTTPERFDGVELELAGDHLSMTEIAEVLSRVLGTRLRAPEMTVEQAVAAGMPPMGAALEWLNVAGQPGRPRYAGDLGIPLTGFEEWAVKYLRPDALSDQRK